MHDRVEPRPSLGTIARLLKGLHATNERRVSLAEDTGPIANYVGLIPTTMESGPANGWT